MWRKRRKFHPGRWRFKDRGLALVCFLFIGLGATALSLPAIFGTESSFAMFGIVLGPLLVLLCLAGFAFVIWMRVMRVRYYYALVEYRAARESQSAETRAP